MTPPETILRTMGRRTIEILLWCGAGLGTLSIVAAVAAVTFGIVPLVFTSGSMSPEVPTGSLGLARTVAASELKVGDVVSVTAASGTRVTHRIVATEKQPDVVVLTLKGDTNPAPDQESYRVKEADRVFFTAPYVGRVIAFLTSPWGMFLGGLAVAALLFWAFRRQPPSGVGTGTDPEGQVQQFGGPPVESGKRRADHAKTRTSVTLLAAGIPALFLVTVNSGTTASFTDTGTVTTTGFSTHKVRQPGPLTCTVVSNDITVGTTPLIVNAPPRTDYTYWATVYNQSGVPLSPVQTKQMTGNPGSPVKATFPLSGSIPGGVIRVYSRIGAGTGWQSDDFRRQPFGRQAAELKCGEAIPPIVEFTQPRDNSNETLTDQIVAVCRLNLGLPNDPLACGTAIDPNKTTAGPAPSVQYIFKRRSWVGGNGCWDGDSWGSGCGYRNADRVGDYWSVPGSFKSPYANATFGVRYDYTLTIRATDEDGYVTERSIGYKVS